MGNPPVWFWIVWSVIMFGMIVAGLLTWGGPRS